MVKFGGNKMKKLLALIMIVFLCSCTQNIESIQENNGNIIVEINKTNELLTISQYLGSYFMINDLSIDYKDGSCVYLFNIHLIDKV